MPDLRLIRAELLKLRRRRAMLAICAALTVGAVAVYYLVLAAQGKALGGGAHFDDAVGVLAMTGGVVGVIVGATAGGADIEAGVFRDLVATGRSRNALFAARVPGALAVVLPLLAAAVALDAVLAGHAADLGDGLLQVLVSGTLTAVVSVGLAALFGARGMVMGVVLAFYLGISPLLAQIEALGNARHLIPQVATSRLGGALSDELAYGTAVAVLLGWAALALTAGAWRTRTQEI